jgi:DNA-binding MarR family transcriptional regulator
MTEHDQPLYELILHIRGVFNELKTLSDEMNTDIAITAAMRALMEYLTDHGPTTVPEIAKAKSVTRQHIQTLADALEQRGMLTFEINPRHKRSKLVALTPKGAAAFQTIRDREQTALRQLGADLDANGVRQASEELKKLREALSRIGSYSS